MSFRIENFQNGIPNFWGAPLEGSAKRENDGSVFDAGSRNRIGEALDELATFYDDSVTQAGREGKSVT